MQKYMQSKTGLPTFVAAVGPVSSNRERAVELYAQIRGQRADYGHVRSSTWGFSQLAPLGTSMDFSSSSNPTLTANVKIVSGLPYPGQTGYMPNFCTKGNTDIINLVGHSLGGPTIRMFERLIQQGDATEMAWCVANGVKCNDLYNVSTRPQAAGQVTCIRTMTTLATLHDGSPLHSVLGAGLTNIVKGLILSIQTYLTGLSWFTSAFGFGTTASFYNFDLDRLGGAFAFNSGVGFTTYVNTIFSSSSPLSNSTYYATAAYDLSPEFMINFNNGGPATYTTTKYFAAASGRTTTCGNVGTSCGVWPWTYHQCPWSVTMEALLQATSGLMGELTGGSVSAFCDNNGQVHGAYTTSLTFTSDVEENDGLVSRKGARGPNTNAPTPQPVPGTKPYLIGCGGYVNNGGSCSSSSNSQSDQANWAGMSAGQWYFIDYSYDHMQMIGFFISSWGSSALAYGLPDGSAGGFFGLGAQPKGQGQVYRDVASFINVARGGQPASDSSDETIVNSTGAIVGGTVGGAAFVLAIAAVVFKRSQQEHETPDTIIANSPSIVLAHAESPNPRFGVVSFLRKSLRLSTRSDGHVEDRGGASKKTPFPGEEEARNSPLQSANPDFKHANLATDV